MLSQRNLLNCAFHLVYEKDPLTVIRSSNNNIHRSNNVLFQKHARNHLLNARLRINPRIPTLIPRNSLIPLSHIPLLVGPEVLCLNLAPTHLRVIGQILRRCLILLCRSVECHGRGVERRAGGQMLDLVHCRAAETAGLHCSEEEKMRF